MILSVTGVLLVECYLASDGLLLGVYTVLPSV